MAVNATGTPLMQVFSTSYQQAEAGERQAGSPTSSLAGIIYPNCLQSATLLISELMKQY